MPEEGVPLTAKSHLLTFEEIEVLARHFVRAGVNKIRLTGGEPLVRQDVEKLVERLGAIDGLDTLAITTNGLLLSKKLKRLVAGGIGVFNISLDTLRADRFEQITRRKGLDLVLRAIEDACALSPDVSVKVNCVAMKGVNDDELADFVALTEDLPVEVRFIEFMPFAGNQWQDAQYLPFDEILVPIKDRFPLLAPIDNRPNDTARLFQVPGFAGTVGFISSMSDKFCSTCNRLRITADGNLKVCLFGNSEISLRDLLRQGASPEELNSAIGAAVLRKKEAHAGLLNLVSMENRPMILIGG